MFFTTDDAFLKSIFIAIKIVLNKFMIISKKRLKLKNLSLGFFKLHTLRDSVLS